MPCARPPYREVQVVMNLKEKLLFTRLANFLRAASNLQRVNFFSGFLFSTGYHHHDQAFHFLTEPLAALKLKELSLYGFCLAEHHLDSIIRNAAPTLKKLKLHNIRIRSVGWYQS
ncbi:hypothetical protein K402DRAFT_458087 [Aulographum hederae CBS 113979]|uniref:F-box domain-containing protein n=1 Tax=Aulographum hederae CBS 113979 TaxID=1176131 RepID=A0A6G1GKC6_9PEZI|nr:hypothetical protein K402DRAFT_458087 [Aulographum hederae CBS 113979]